MNPGWWVAAGCFGWLAVWLPFARWEYRTSFKEHTDHYRRIYGGPIPEHAHQRAMNAAYAMFYKWPIVLLFRVFDWLITYRPRNHSRGEYVVPGTLWPDELEIVTHDDLQAELDKEAARQRGERYGL